MYYRKAHQMKQRRRNQELWLLGAYVYEAFSDVAPVLHAFAKKGTKPSPYPAEPFPLTDRDAKERKRQDERQQYEKQKKRFEALAANLNKQQKGGTE